MPSTTPVGFRFIRTFISIRHSKLAAIEALGHHDEVARTAGPLGMRERDRAALRIPQTLVIPGQLVPEIHDVDVHLPAAVTQCELFGCPDQNAAESPTLKRWGNR